MEQRRKETYPARGGVAVVVSGGSRRWRRWSVMLLLLLPYCIKARASVFFFVFFSSVLFPILYSILSSVMSLSRPSLFFLLFSVSSFFSLLFSLLLLSSILLLFLSSLMCLLSPLYLEGRRETSTPAQSMAQGCRVDGAATVQPPLYHPRDTSPPQTLTRGKLCRWRVPSRRLFGSSGEGKVVKTGGRKIFFFPCFARPGEEERLQCRSKWHCFGLFFFVNSA